MTVEDLLPILTSFMPETEVKVQIAGELYDAKFVYIPATKNNNKKVACIALAAE